MKPAMSTRGTFAGFVPPPQNRKTTRKIPEWAQVLNHHHAIGPADPRPERRSYEKAILAVAAAAVIAAGTMSASTAANAGCYGCGVGAGVAGGLSPVPSSAAPSPTASRATTRRRRATWCTGATANPIRWLAQAAIGRVGRSPSTPMATRSARSRARFICP